MTTHTQFSDAELDEIVEDGIAAGALSDPRTQRMPAVVVRGRWLKDVEPEPIDWLLRGYIAFGCTTLVESDPKTGKSTLTADIAATLSSGRAFFDGTRHEPAVCLFLTYEDSAAITVRPRIEAAGGDVSKIKVLDCVVLNGEEQLFSLPEHINAIRSEVEATGARLLVIDPLSAALSSEVNSYKDTDVRRALAPLKVLAEETGIAIVVVRHLTKGARGNAIHAGGGSIAIAAAARMVLAVHKDPNDESGSRRILAVAGTNLGKTAPSRAYTIVSDPQFEVGRIEWGEEVTFSADELTAGRGDEDGKAPRDEAKEFLRNFLAKGPRLKREVVRSARQEGIKDRTLDRAKRDLGIIRTQDFGGPAEWQLPTSVRPEDPVSPDSRQVSPLSHIWRSGKTGKTGETETGDDQPELLEIKDGVRHYSDGSQELTDDRIAQEVARRAAKAAEPAALRAAP